MLLTHLEGLDYLNTVADADRDEIRAWLDSVFALRTNGLDAELAASEAVDIIVALTDLDGWREVNGSKALALHWAQQHVARIAQRFSMVTVG